MLAKVKRVAFWAVIGFSIISLVFSPFGSLKDKVIGSGKWLILGGFATEALFILGLVIMAAAMGYKIGNPFKLRKDLKQLLIAGFRSKPFWVGFWVNLAGSVGTTALMAIGIFTVLPPSSWGLMVWPAADLSATIVIRSYVFQRRNAYPVPRGE